jgi:hypothetical protein
LVPAGHACGNGQSGSGLLKPDRPCPELQPGQSLPDRACDQGRIFSVLGKLLRELSAKRSSRVAARYGHEPRRLSLRQRRLAVRGRVIETIPQGLRREIENTRKVHLVCKPNDSLSLALCSTPLLITSCALIGLPFLSWERSCFSPRSSDFASAGVIHPTGVQLTRARAARCRAPFSAFSDCSSALPSPWPSAGTRAASNSCLTKPTALAPRGFARVPQRTHSRRDSPRTRGLHRCAPAGGSRRDGSEEFHEQIARSERNQATMWRATVDQIKAENSHFSPPP